MPRQATQMIKSIENFIEAVRADSTSWNPKEPKWFRGEPRSLTPLLPAHRRLVQHTRHGWVGRIGLEHHGGTEIGSAPRHCRLARKDDGGRIAFSLHHPLGLAGIALWSHLWEGSILST